jgi:hypothetical protein
MLEEGEEGSVMTEEIDRPLEESEVGPTPIDVTDEPVSIGPTSIDFRSLFLTSSSCTHSSSSRFYLQFFILFRCYLGYWL